MIRALNSPERGWLRRLEFGDALTFFYALALIRQYFWVLENNLFAWILSSAVTAVFFYLFVSTKQVCGEKCGPSFWVLVGLPLLIAFSMRAAFPDQSYDVWNYRLLHSDRSLHGSLYGPGDYFPTALPFNPVADTLTGISRLFLGYRLGTIINLVALLCAAQIIHKILRPFIRASWLVSAAVLLIVLTENLLFEISTYMVDLLTLPVLLQATFLTLNADEAKNPRTNFLHVSLLLGISTAFKFTNLAVAIPIAAICIYKVLAGRLRNSPTQIVTTALFMLIAFAAPVLPFTIYIYRLTGNPVFPIANTFFKSVYWPTHGGWDNRWGPQNIWQTIVWPVMIWFKPERHSELAVYSGRLSIGFIVAIVGLFLVWPNKKARTVCLLLVASSLLWSAIAMGYSRYGLFQDVLAGVTVCIVVSDLVLKNSWRQVSWRTVVAFVLCAVLVVQAYFAWSYNLQQEWGRRTTLLNEPQLYAQEMKLAFFDHSLRNFLTEEDRARFNKVQVWFETAPKSTGFEVLLNRNAPVIAVRQSEFFFTRDAWRQFIYKVNASSGQEMYSLCMRDDLPQARQAILERGLEVGEVTALNVPWFSPRTQIGMMLIEVRLPQLTDKREQFETAWMKGAFAAADYREEIVALNPPSRLATGETAELQFKVKNLGTVTWPAVGTKDFKYQVNIGNRWVARGVTTEDSRAVMSRDLPPGGEVEVKLTVHAPRTPGEYTLEIDMVHEGVTWFKERGAKPLLLRVLVQP